MEDFLWSNPSWISYKTSGGISNGIPEKMLVTPLISPWKRSCRKCHINRWKFFDYKPCGISEGIQGRVIKGISEEIKKKHGAIS